MRRTLTILLAAAWLAVAQCSQAITVPVPYTVTQEGKVSLAVYNSTGLLVRTLLTGARKTAGNYVEAWDGLDRYGNAVPTGTYTWKLLQTQGLTAEFLMDIGDNPSPKWEGGAGNHGAPAAIAADASGVYRMATMSEGAHGGVKTDLSGNYLWTCDNWRAVPSIYYGLALAVGNGNLYELAGDGTVYGYYADSGHCFTAGDYSPQPWNMRWTGDPSTGDYTGGGEKAVMDLALDTANNLLVVSYQNHNAIQWFDAGSGAYVDQATTLTAPLGVTVTGDGTVLVISNGAVVSLTRANKTPQTVIPASQLSSPYRLAVDSSDNIFVAENSLATGGQAAQQVLKFTWTGSGTATLLSSFGAVGGRTDGVYVPTNFLDLHEIAVDNAGGFYIAEGPWTLPRRSGHFDGSGNLLYEWYGGQEYGNTPCPEPNDPTHVWFHANAPIGGMVRCSVDYTNNTWSVAEVYGNNFANNLLAGNGSCYFHLLTYNNRTYIYTGDPGSLTIMLYDPNAHTLRLCCQSGLAYRSDLQQWYIPPSLRPTDGSTPLFYIWNDLNDDGVATLNEMSFYNFANNWSVGGFIDPQTMTIYTSVQGTGGYPCVTIPVNSFTAGGTPIYYYTPTACPQWNENGELYYPDHLYHDTASGNWYGTFSQGLPVYENHGVYYFNLRSGIDRLVQWDSNWNPQWSVGRHSPDPDHQIGSSADAEHLVGVANNCVIRADASDEETSTCTVWTDDGLYVDEVPHTQGEGSPSSIYGLTNTLETPQYNFYTNADGSIYLYSCSSTGGSPIYHVTGWDGWQRSNRHGDSPLALALGDEIGYRAVRTIFQQHHLHRPARAHAH